MIIILNSYHHPVSPSAPLLTAKVTRWMATGKTGPSGQSWGGSLEHSPAPEHWLTV